MLLEDLAARIRSGSVAMRYGTAFVVSALVLLLRFGTNWGSILPLVTLYPAVLLAAWAGGRGPGLFACSVCALVAYRDLLTVSFNFSRYGDWFALTLFAGIGAMMVLIIDSLARTKQILEEQSRRLAEETAERARTEERLRSMQEIDAAEAANRAKDAFLAMVSHDLRMPLQSVLGAVQVLKRSALPKEAGTLSPIDRTQCPESGEAAAGLDRHVTHFRRRTGVEPAASKYPFGGGIYACIHAAEIRRKTAQGIVDKSRTGAAIADRHRPRPANRLEPHVECRRNSPSSRAGFPFISMKTKNPTWSLQFRTRGQASMRRCYLIYSFRFVREIQGRAGRDWGSV